MKLFRYRKPSLNRMLGITALKRQAKHALGISQFEGWTRPSQLKQKLKQKAGLYSPEMTAIRQTSRGKFPSLFGLFSRRK